MIVPGTAIVNANTVVVELRAPLGFNSVQGVRLSNFGTDTLILTNIGGNDQSQEYLPPQTQMVFKSVNTGNTPFVVGYTAPPTQVAANLLVEWSTDPDNDFLGTYPASLPVGVSAANGVYKFKEFVSGAPTGVSNKSRFVVGTLPQKYGYVRVKFQSHPDGGMPYFIRVQEENSDAPDHVVGSCAVAYIASPLGGWNGGDIEAFLPFIPSNTQPIVIEISSPSALVGVYGNVIIDVYTSSVPPVGVPNRYVDIPNPLVYSDMFTPAAPAGTDIAERSIGLHGATDGLGLTMTPDTLVTCDVTLAMRTSGTGLITNGWVSHNPGVYGDDAIIATIFGGPPYIDTGDCAVIAGASYDILTGRRTAVSIPSAGQLHNNEPFDQVTFNYLNTTDTGNITIEVTLTQAGSTVGSYNTEDAS